MRQQLQLPSNHINLKVTMGCFGYIWRVCIGCGIGLRYDSEKDLYIYQQILIHDN